MTDKQTGVPDQFEAQEKLGEFVLASLGMGDPVDEPAPEEGEEIEASDDAIEDDTEDGVEASGEEHESDEGGDEPSTYTVVVSGEEVEVTLPELIAGYSRQQDYTRKTQAVSDERKAVEAQMAELRQERMQYAAALPRLQELLESARPQRPNPNDFADPMEFARADHQWQEITSQIDAITAERNRIADQQQKDQLAQWESVVQQEQQKLLDKLPTWRDENVRSKETQELTGWLKQQGYSDEEVGGLVDHRAILVARKAMAYDGLNVKAKAKPKKTKTVAPGSTRGVKRSNQTRDVVEHAKQTGKESDAARAFTALLAS